MPQTKIWKCFSSSLVLQTTKTPCACPLSLPLSLPTFRIRIPSFSLSSPTRSKKRSNQEKKRKGAPQNAKCLYLNLLLPAPPPSRRRAQTATCAASPLPRRRCRSTPRSRSPPAPKKKMAGGPWRARRVEEAGHLQRGPLRHPRRRRRGRRPSLLHRPSLLSLLTP